MSGIIVAVLAVAWMTISVVSGIALTHRLARKNVRIPLAIAFTAVLFPLPLIDEIVASQQFKKLCENNSSVWINPTQSIGRTVYFSEQPDVHARGTWVPIAIKPKHFIDAENGKLVVRYNELVATGGKLAQSLKFSEGIIPLIFRGTCVPTDRPGSVETFKRLGISYIEPPITHSGERK